jgi:hypothetical protein
MVLDTDSHPEDGAKDAPATSADSEPVAAVATWRGISGVAIPHVVYSLIDCPAMVNAVYLLVHCRPGGERRVLAIDMTETTIPSLNLARVRHDGARFGANEVHVHAGTGARADHSLLRRDLALALMGGNDAGA